MQPQASSSKALRDQLRAHCTHEVLRFALSGAYLVLLVTSFISIAEVLNEINIYLVLLVALTTVINTTLLMFAYMLTDILDALLRLYTAPPEPPTHAPAMKLKEALSQLREATAYGALRNMLLLCYVVVTLASIALSVSAIFSVAAGGLIIFMFARAVVDIADALLIAQSHRPNPA
jgi:hypothetical protein